MGIRDLVFKNERVVNQANYLLTTLTTLLIAVVSTSVQSGTEHAMFWPLVAAWSLVFVMRLVDTFIQNSQTISDKQAIMQFVKVHHDKLRSNIHDRLDEIDKEIDKIVVQLTNLQEQINRMPSGGVTATY